MLRWNVIWRKIGVAFGRNTEAAGSKEPKSTDDVVCDQPSGEVFPWPKGVTIIPQEAIVLAVPAAVCGDGDPIGSIIQTSDDAHVSLPGPPGNHPDLIFVRLRAGDPITIGRSCQAFIAADPKRTFRIRVVGVDAYKRSHAAKAAESTPAH